ncbi:MAG: hypothetical protein JWO20_2298, partial [Candidatus Angelobacter sp.]|nr:hypothetical protein [Candidatus Angelobacter sp.]
MPLVILVVATPPDAALVSPLGRAVEPLVHAPDAVQSAGISGIAVVDDAVLEHERAHARPLARVRGHVGSDDLKTAIAARVKAPAPATVTAPAAAPALTISSDDRDALFTVLAEETELFLQDVKLTNKSLDSIITAGAG